MKKKSLFCAGVFFIFAFALWTVLVRLIDVQAIGPNGSSVGFATINGFVHRITGSNISLYIITDWLSLVPIGVAFAFALLGLIQWIKRKRLNNVDKSIRRLGIFYIIVMAVYVLFEVVVINYRPVLIQGYLEASYPSSTTMLVLCVMPTAMMLIQSYIKSLVIKRCIIITIILFIAFMVIGRVLSGVHWITDIIGGILFSAGIDLLFCSMICLY